jgi:hypothetical protein
VTINGVKLQIYCPTAGDVKVLVERANSNVEFCAWGIKTENGGPPAKATIVAGVGMPAQGITEAQQGEARPRHKSDCASAGSPPKLASRSAMEGCRSG